MNHVEVSLTFYILHIHKGSKEKGNGRILNGEDSDVLPYQVYLTTMTGACGGSIIEDKWVLTAKHCVVKDWDNRDFTPVATTILAGISNL